MDLPTKSLFSHKTTKVLRNPDPEYSGGIATKTRRHEEYKFYTKIYIPTTTLIISI